jgi:5-methylcytosine-specific restriction endonuclease McrA
MDSAVLVLNQNYEPLNVCQMRRAIVLIIGGKAEIMENGQGFIHTPTAIFPRPSVIRLEHMIKRPRPRVKLTRREVFRRDNYTCQYCGTQTHDLTLDHVVPRHRGGAHDWANLVSACRICNRRKGGKTLAEAHMRMLRKPFEPVATLSHIFYNYLEDHAQWWKFLEGWEKK